MSLTAASGYRHLQILQGDRHHLVESRQSDADISNVPYQSILREDRRAQIARLSYPYGTIIQRTAVISHIRFCAVPARCSASLDAVSCLYRSFWNTYGEYVYLRALRRQPAIQERRRVAPSATQFSVSQSPAQASAIGVRESGRPCAAGPLEHVTIDGNTPVANGRAVKAPVLDALLFLVASQLSTHFCGGSGLPFFS